jgi:hypothetical protein
MMRYWLTCATPAPEKVLPVPAMKQFIVHVARDSRSVDVELYLVRNVAVVKWCARHGEWTGFTTDSMPKLRALAPVCRMIRELIDPRIQWHEGSTTFKPFINLASTGIGGEIRGRMFRGNERLAHYIDRGYLVLLACTLWVDSFLALDPVPDASIQRYAWESVGSTLAEVAQIEQGHEQAVLQQLAQWFQRHMLDSATLAALLRTHLLRAQETMLKRFSGYREIMQEGLVGLTE